VKLLFDQNLSPGLVSRLSRLYPGSIHVCNVGLDRASDAVLWNYARQHGYTIVTQDVDFSEMSDVLGFPPKVIWIRCGNCSTSQIESILRQHGDAIANLDSDPTAGILALL
jgi:predicted nuclease of predicted toxin-antitoxin system